MNILLPKYDTFRRTQVCGNVITSVYTSAGVACDGGTFTED